MVELRFGEPHFLGDVSDRVNEKLHLYIREQVVIYIEHYKIYVNLANFLELLVKVRLVNLFE